MNTINNNFQNFLRIIYINQVDKKKKKVPKWNYLLGMEGVFGKKGLSLLLFHFISKSYLVNYS